MLTGGCTRIEIKAADERFQVVQYFFAHPVDRVEVQALADENDSGG